MAIIPGTRLGPYEVTAQIGEGGMGEVYRGRDTRLGRDVAIKVLPSGLAQDADRMSRFEREARATSALSHPNILTVFDIGVADGTHYIVEELLEGRDLRAEFATGVIPPRLVLDYARQVASGLSAAHAKGVVHRDLKPENIFVITDGRVKILDFGVAKLREPVAATRIETTRIGTTPGTIVGTVGYMAPEQVRGAATDARSDLFALGAILYEMLSGTRAFQGASSVEVLNAILKEEPPELTGAGGRISPVLERIVRRCLDKRPEHRFQTASDLGFALEALAPVASADSRTATDGAVARGSNSRGGKWRDLALVGMTGIALALIGRMAWVSFRDTPPPPSIPMTLSFLPPEGTSIGQLVLSPDGRLLAFTGATGSKVQLWVRSMATKEVKPLQGTDGAYLPFWSPDSQSLGFYAGGSLKTVDVGGRGGVLIKARVRIGSGGTWNRDNVILYTVLGEKGILRVSGTEGQPPIVTPLMPGETDHAEPFFLPDGHHFLFYVSSADKEKRGIYLGALDNPVKRRILPDVSNVQYANFGGRGCLIFGRDGQLQALPFNLSTLQPDGQVVSISPTIGTLAGSTTQLRHRNFSVSNAGIIVLDEFPRRYEQQIRWVDRTGALIRKIELGENFGPLGVALGRDDIQLVAAKGREDAGDSDLVRADVTGENLDEFTFGPGVNQFPVWSPDGSRIVWASNRNSSIYRLYEKASNGAGDDALLFGDDVSIFPTDWSRDLLLFRRNTPGFGYDIFARRMSDGKTSPVLHTTSNEVAAVLSPDSKRIAYASDVSDRYEIYVQQFPDGSGKRMISTDGGDSPRWSHSGEELYFQTLDGALMTVSLAIRESVESGVPKTLFSFRRCGTLAAPYYSVSRDGRHFLLCTTADLQASAPVTVLVNWRPPER